MESEVESNAVCPVCGKSEYETCTAPDGELGSRSVSHLRCAIEVHRQLEFMARNMSNREQRRAVGLLQAIAALKMEQHPF